MKKGGRQVLVNVIPNVAVIACFSDDPEMLTCFEFLSAKVRVETRAYFDGVSSVFNIIEYGILYFPTFDTIL